LSDGVVFESTTRIGRSVVLDLTQVIPCLKDALALMKVGGRARVVCPSELAWGENGHPPLVKPGATVAFDLELVDLVK
jgi:FKBP-type peptidyl-prolyl cis-trans isomerase FkpA/FKBP-type peptidyl-prolyl cis-trans isomerase FklB